MRFRPMSSERYLYKKLISPGTKVCRYLGMGCKRLISTNKKACLGCLTTTGRRPE